MPRQQFVDTIALVIGDAGIVRLNRVELKSKVS